MNAALRRLRKIAGRLLGLADVAREAAGIRLLVLTRAVRLALVARGLLRKEYLVLRSSTHVPGMFAEFASVLGLLAHYDQWRDCYAGIRVDFADEGLYYDPRVGENWWEYFFLPVDLGAPGDAPARVVGTLEQISFAQRIERGFPRGEAARLIARYVSVRPHILDKVDAYVRDNLAGAFAIGIHYRGTDKFLESPRVPYEAVLACALEKARELGTNRHVIFVATDEQGFLEFMLAAVPGRVRYCDAFRSVDGTPIDIRMGDNYKKGEEAVLDCLLLSRCDFLIRTSSDLSLCSTFFNPGLPVVQLGRPD